MNGNKLSMPLWGKPLIRHAVEAVLASQAANVVVVTGNESHAVEGALSGLNIRFVKNFAYASGLSSSLKCGVTTLSKDSDGAVILLGDMPLVASSLIDRLIAAFAPEEQRAIVVPVRQSRRGNPVLWASRFYREMLALEGDIGAKQLMTPHSDLVYEVESDDDGPLIDIDTPEALTTLSSVREIDAKSF
jgi:molybdenum cofactor cytidylyltransferase